MNKDIHRINLEELEKYFHEKMIDEVEEIKELLKEGKSKSEIILMGKFSKESLFNSGVGLSTVVPKKEPQGLCDEYEYSVPNEGKFEYADGIVFLDKYERDCFLLYLLGNVGLKRTIEILPEESKEILRKLLDK